MKRGADQSAQVRTNPIFMTGKTAICLMAKGEIPDADKILRSLKLEDYNRPFGHESKFPLQVYLQDAYLWLLA